MKKMLATIMGTLSISALCLSTAMADVNYSSIKSTQITGSTIGTYVEDTSENVKIKSDGNVGVNTIDSFGATDSVIGTGIIRREKNIDVKAPEINIGEVDLTCADNSVIGTFVRETIDNIMAKQIE